MSRLHKPGGKSLLEEQISRTLHRQARSLQVTSADEERMRCSVHRRIKEESAMRKWSTRKILVVAAAVCVLGSITAIAAGKVTNSSGHSSHLDEFKYDQLGKMESELGFATKAPEAFSNGYRFDTGMPVMNEGRDDEGNVVKEGKSLSLNYKKDGVPDIFVSVENISLYDEQSQGDQTFDHNGIAITFSSDNYLFVPPDYEISEEEKAKEEAGELYISYGSDQVEHKTIQSMLWEDGGVFYCITSFDSPLTAQELAQMAGEIIDNQ